MTSGSCCRRSSTRPASAAVWSQFRRWSRNGTCAQALTVLLAAARREDERVEETPSMVVIDTHLGLQVACIATTFRHLSRHDARASTMAVAV